jgi:hypothetical protein
MTVKNIPNHLRTPAKELGKAKVEVKALEELQIGANPNTLLSCKITNVISQKGEVPAYIQINFIYVLANLYLLILNQDLDVFLFIMSTTKFMIKSNFKQKFH